MIEEQGSSSERAGIPNADTPTEMLFALLRHEISILCERAYGTKEGWARYTIAGELVELLAARSILPSRLAVAALTRRLRSPDYRISTSLLHEAADLLDAIAAGSRQGGDVQDD